MEYVIVFYAASVVISLYVCMQPRMKRHMAACAVSKYESMGLIYTDKMIAVCVLIGVVIIAIAPFYNTRVAIKGLAKTLNGEFK